jgi:hypothetical protein
VCLLQKASAYLTLEHHCSISYFKSNLSLIPKLTGAFTEQELLISAQTLSVKDRKRFAITWAVLGFQEPAGTLKNMLSDHHAIVVVNVKERDLEDLLVEMISWLTDGGLFR